MRFSLPRSNFLSKSVGDFSIVWFIFVSNSTVPDFFAHLCLFTHVIFCWVFGMRKPFNEKLFHFKMAEFEYSFGVRDPLEPSCLGPLRSVQEKRRSPTSHIVNSTVIFLLSNNLLSSPNLNRLKTSKKHGGWGGEQNWAHMHRLLCILFLIQKYREQINQVSLGLAKNLGLHKELHMIAMNAYLTKFWSGQWTLLCGLMGKDRQSESEREGKRNREREVRRRKKSSLKKPTENSLD